jgi:HEAT repeat protein
LLFLFVWLGILGFALALSDLKTNEPSDIESIEMGTLMTTETNDRRFFAALLSDPDPSNRVRGIQYFGASKDQFATRELVSLLHDQDPYVRGWSAWALAEIGDLEAVVPIAEALARYDTPCETSYCPAARASLSDFHDAIKTLMQSRNLEEEIGAYGKAPRRSLRRLDWQMGRGWMER